MSNMSTILPTISVTDARHSQSESSDNDSDSNDMNYNDSAGGVTDVEDLDSQADILEESRSRKSSRNALILPSRINKDNDATDVEDYNDSDSENDEKSIAYPEIKLSLNEFLQVGIQEQAVVDGDSKEKIEIKSGDFLQAQNLNATSDYLTDCEDYDTDSEVEYACEKSVCVDLDTAVDSQGKVCIADIERPNDESEDYDDVSMFSDISDVTSAISDATGASVHGMSEDELLNISGDEEVCQIAYSGSSSESDDDNSSSIDRRSNVPTIDVTFIPANDEQRRQSIKIMNNKKAFLNVSKKHEEVLTDVEKLDDSAADDDSFDSEEGPEQPIPRAVILAPGDDGLCQTDSEDILLDELSLSTVSEVRAVAENSLPPSHREMIVLKEDKYGDTIMYVTPMDNEFQFGIYNNFKDDAGTEDEDYSCAEELEQVNSVAEELLAAQNLIESDFTVANEVLKTHTSKRLELHINAEPVTDVEEIYVDGTNRRKKLKNRSMSKGKSKFLDIAKSNKDDGGTDVEDIDLSENGLPPTVKIASSERQQKANTTSIDKVTDIEDITADEVSDVSDVDDVPQIKMDISNLKEYFANSSNVIVSLEADPTKKGDKHPKPLRITQMLKPTMCNDDSANQPNTDVEDMQCPSDADDACSNRNEQEINCNYKELNDMLNESYTVVHEKNSSAFDAEAEKLHIKTMPDTRDAHTDIEYVESDESAARGGN